MKQNQNLMAMDAGRMTSLEIAAVTGKPHGDVLKAIRKMEKAWEQECGGNFSLTSEKVNMPQGGVRLIPVFSLTKTECLYVATKFNDAARARLVLRWEQLERANALNDKGKMINDKGQSLSLLLPRRGKERTCLSGLDTNWHGVYKDYCLKEQEPRILKTRFARISGRAEFTN